MSKSRPSFYELKDFPPLEALSKDWELIRQEYLELTDHVMDIHRVDKNHQAVMEEIGRYILQGNPFGWVVGWGQNGPNPDWIQYGLIAFDNVIPFVKPRMSKTLTALRRIKGIKVCALVKMKPHCFLSCHRHPEIHEEGLLQMHIPLETAPPEQNYAYLNVNGEFRQHVCGRPIVFDGSLDHFALNASEESRTILYMEFDREMNRT